MAADEGSFKPINPQKFMGDPTKIVYKSRLELIMMSHLDRNPAVIAWGYEKLVVPYKSPKDGKIHRYFTDLQVVKKGRDGNTEKLVIEIKPRIQRFPPKKPSRITPKYLKEELTWRINQSKWKAASELCKNKGWKFLVIDEQDMGYANWGRNKRRGR